MAPGPRDVDVLLYGATGYTGRLTARALEEKEITYAIAGRDEKRLGELSASLPSHPKTHAVPIDDAAGLERIAATAGVVLSTAGPYTRLGPPLVEAALAARSHFLDVTGEQAYLRWVFGQDKRARDAGITIVNALGLDVIPGDIAARVATAAMQEPQDLEVAYWTPAAPSRGTLASMAAHTGLGGWYDHGTYRNASPGWFRRSFRFPDPHGTREGIFIPWGDAITAPRTTGAKRVRTYFIARPGTVRMMHTFRALVAASWTTGLTRFFLKAKLRTYPDPDPREQAEVPFRVLAEATDADGTVQRGYVAGKDPYGFTAAAVAHAASILAREDAPHGVLTPTQAFTFGPFIAALDGFDLDVKGRSL